MHDERGAVERRQATVANGRLHSPRKAGDFFFAIARHVHAAVAHPEPHTTGSCARLARLEPHFLDVRKNAVHPLVERAGEHSIRHDDIELGDSRRTRQQIPVGGSEAVPVDRTIRHRDNDMAIGARRRFADDHEPPQFVFVGAVLRAHRRSKSRKTAARNRVCSTS